MTSEEGGRERGSDLDPQSPLYGCLSTELVFDCGFSYDCRRAIRTAYQFLATMPKPLELELNNPMAGPRNMPMVIHHNNPLGCVSLPTTIHCQAVSVLFRWNGPSDLRCGDEFFFCAETMKKMQISLFFCSCN